MLFFVLQVRAQLDLWDNCQFLEMAHDEGVEVLIEYSRMKSGKLLNILQCIVGPLGLKITWMQLLRMLRLRAMCCRMLIRHLDNV